MTTLKRPSIKVKLKKPFAGYEADTIFTVQYIEEGLAHCWKAYGETIDIPLELIDAEV